VKCHKVVQSFIAMAKQAFKTLYNTAF